MDNIDGLGNSNPAQIDQYQVIPFNQLDDNKWYYMKVVNGGEAEYEKVKIIQKPTNEDNGSAQTHKEWRNNQWEDPAGGLLPMTVLEMGDARITFYLPNAQNENVIMAGGVKRKNRKSRKGSRKNRKNKKSRRGNRRH
jgi:hypothetical protein